MVISAPPKIAMSKHANGGEDPSCGKTAFSENHSGGLFPQRRSPPLRGLTFQPRCGAFHMAGRFNPPLRSGIIDPPFPTMRIALIAILLSTLPMTALPATPPVPPKISHEITWHGDTRIDPYFWMRERKNPAVLAHLKAENAYTEAMLAGQADLREQLFLEIVGRIEEDDTSAPYRKGDYEYFSRIQKGQSYRAYYRKALNDEDAEDELILNANELAADNAYFELGMLDVSPDGTKLAYAIDTEGDEEYVLFFIDMATRLPVSAPIPATTGEGEWAADSLTFFYALQDSTKRSDRILRHRLGNDPGKDPVVYREPDPLFNVGIYSSQDETQIYALSISKETTEIAVLSAMQPEDGFEVVFPRRTGIRYFLEHHKGEFLVRTNENAPDFKILATPTAKPDLANARIILPYRTGRRIESVLPLENHWIFSERQNGLDQIRIWNLQTHTETLLDMPDKVYTLSEGSNEEWQSERFQFSYSSPIRPETVYEIDLNSLDRKVLKQTRVPSGHDPDAYTAYRKTATAPDGTEIPLTLFHRKDIALNGTAPGFLHGYGSYGSVVEPYFRSSWLTWLERGFVVAIAHPRGGGLLGEEWYQAGKLHQKSNTFTDFIACADFLLENKFVAKDRLGIEGGSAGGLLMGAVLNMAPDRFAAAVAEVPFVDVLNTMLDESIPLTTFEFEEWGNPKEEAFYQTMRAYSPYDNIRSQSYPPILITAGLNDPYVQYWEAMKWAARLRDHDTSPESPVLLKTNLDSGHMGSSGRYDYLWEIALSQAFLLDTLQP